VALVGYKQAIGYGVIAEDLAGIAGQQVGALALVLAD
jgi:hypothetical protein